MSNYLNAIREQLSMAAAIIGKPSARASIVFSGPPRESLLDTREIYPLGMLATIVTQDSRTNIQQKAIGMTEDIDYGFQEGRKIGSVSGLVMFLPDTSLEILEDTTAMRTHFLKMLYAPVRGFNKGSLVKPFYKASKTGESFFEPIAYDDSDRWRNFSSPFYSIPFGLYKLEKAEGQQVLEATYYEGVKLEGSMNLQLQVQQNVPQFEQFGFTYTRAVPMKPSLEDLSIAGAEDVSAEDISGFTDDLQKYLGIL